MTAMTELQFMQEGGVGESRRGSSRRQFEALAAFLRSHGHFEVADVVDDLRERHAALLEENGPWV